MNKSFVNNSIVREISVISTLRELMESGAIVRMTAPYVRGTVKTEVVGQTRPNYDVTILNLTANKEVENFSVSTKVNVENNGEAGIAYRTYNIVRDGELIVSEFAIDNIGNTTFNKLRVANLLFHENGNVVTANEVLNDETYIVRFNNVPIVVGLENKVDDLVKYIKRDTELSAELSAVRKAIKAKSVATVPTGDATDKPEVKKDEAIETYVVRTVVYDIPAYKYASETDYSVYDAETLEKVKKEMSDEQRDVRLAIRMITFCIEHNQGAIAWGESKPLPRSKNKEFQTAQVGGDVLRRVTGEKEIER